MSPSGLIAEAKQEILEGIRHLEYSFQKVQGLSSDVRSLDSENLETWEGLVSRFGRVSDIFLSKYIRARVLEADPAFRGTFRDFLDQAEKMGIIQDVDPWMEIRELRNSSVHEYSSKKVPLLLERVREKTPILIDLKNTLP